MSPSAWSWDPLILLSIGLVAIVYARGVRRIRRRTRRAAPELWRATSFGSGLAILVVALQSPISTYDNSLFNGTALTTSPVFVMELLDGQTEIIVQYGAVCHGDSYPDEWTVERFVWTPDWLPNLSALLTRATPAIIGDVLAVLETAGEIPSRSDAVYPLAMYVLIWGATAGVT